MARIPPLRRLITEDFRDQAGWIEKLIQPINDYWERNTSALNKGLTINDNFAGAIKTVELDGVFPVKLSWDVSARPVAVLVGNWARSDGRTDSVVVATTTGDITNASNVVANVASVAGLRFGLRVTGTGIPDDTFVVSVSGSSVTLSNNATATTVGVSLSFTKSSEAVQVQWSFNQNGQLQINSVMGITPTALTKYRVTLVCLTG